MEEPVTQDANAIIDAVEASKSALQQASAADRAMAVILSAETLQWVIDRATADHNHFVVGFRLPRELAGSC
jgi:hypothetical protein